MMKRFLVLVLATTLILGTMAVGVFADEEDETYTADFVDTTNLWFAADDEVIVYIHGDPIIELTSNEGTPYSNAWRDAYKATIPMNTTFIAAKANDLHKSNAGFKLVFEGESEDDNIVTDGSWYYYVGEDVPEVDANEKKWYEEAYEGDMAEWESANELDPNANPTEMYSNWADVGSFGSNGGNEASKWIWDEGYDHEETVYFRSMKPTETTVPDITYTVTTINNNPTLGTITGTITGLKLGDVVSVLATENNGLFDKWEVAGEIGPDSQPPVYGELRFVVKGDVTVTASFSESSDDGDDNGDDGETGDDTPVQSSAKPTTYTL
ncbi:MAG: hypothetical protein PF505_06155 [Vallitaleaceae bacterium]|jgi:hypothetical protein|nr:hypothetical protein [Vallitaleaceae bacterium]